MSEARQAILSAVAMNKKKDSLTFDTGDYEAIRHTLPGCARLSNRGLQELFEEKAVASAATVEHIGSLNELPNAVRRYLLDTPRQTGLQKLYLNHPLLAPLDWSGEMPDLDISADSALFVADVSIACACCGIAETGSIVLLSEADVSSAAYFLPEILIVALAKDQIVPVQESAWSEILTANTRLPRTLTLVTGPSRTGDIEQKLIIGAHGPREVHLVLYDR